MINEDFDTSGASREVTNEMDFNVSIQGRTIIGAGSIVLSSQDKAVLVTIEDLKVQFVFDDASSTLGVRTEIINDKEHKVIFAGFNNPLGTSYEMPRFATVGEKVYRLSLLVQAVAQEPSETNPPPRVLSYTLSIES